MTGGAGREKRYRSVGLPLRNFWRYDREKYWFKTYGAPVKLYVDNGAPYANAQLTHIGGFIGTVLIHLQQQKYYIERTDKQANLYTGVSI